MIEASAFIHIDAPPEGVAAIYADVAGWPRTFSATIRSARIVSETPGELQIEGAADRLAHCVASCWSP